MKIVTILALVSACWAQQQNSVQTGTIDASGISKYKPPLKTVATLPTASSNTNALFIVTDGTSSSDCTGGGGSTRAICISDGSAWVTMGGGGGGSQTSIFSGGTQVQKYVQCAHGSTLYTDLNGLANTPSGEITIQTGVSGDVRWDQVKLSESTQFTGPTGLTGLTVSMGRPGNSNHDELTGTSMALQVSSSDANYWSAKPIPPQLSSTYSIVLNFFTPYYYATGTVTTNGTTAVTGSGTTWTSTMDQMWMQIGSTWYQFTYSSATTGTLSATVPTASGQAYILQNLPNQVTGGSLDWELCGYKGR